MKLNERRSGRSFFQACARFLLYALLFVGFLVTGLRSPHVPRLALLIFCCSFLDSFLYGTNFSMINSFSKVSVVGQVGLEPTTALSTGFTVRGDTNYTVLTHMAWTEGLEPPTPCFVGRYSIRLSYVHIVVEPAGIEPATPRFSVWRSTNWATVPYFKLVDFDQFSLWGRWRESNPR